MKKCILILVIGLSAIIYACSKSDSKNDTSASRGTCFECTVQNT